MDFNYNINKPLWDPSNFTFTNFSPTYSGNVGFGGFQTPWFGSNSSGTENSNTDTYESWKKESAKKREENRKKSEFLKERSNEIAKTEELIEAQEKLIDDIKKGKKANNTYIIETAKLEGPKLKEDGTIDKEAAKPKKKGFLAKTGEWLSSAGAALTNIGKSLIGFDENGKWSWKKCLKNAAITAAAVGASFIPVVGPAIGYGLLTAGAISGGVGVVKGISKLNDATTEEAKEQARQDICAGAFVGISSALGLRGLGKSVSAAAKASGTNTATMGISAVAKTRTGIAKPIQVISQAARDITVNAFKATTNAMKADKALIAASGGGIKGFGKAYNTKVKTALYNTNNWGKKYQDKFNEMETSLNSKITELNNKIAAETNASKRALLQEQKRMLENNLNELHSISDFKSKTEFDKLNTQNSGIKNQEQLSSYTQNSRGGYEINGQSISEQRFNAFKKEVNAMQKTYVKDLKKLNQLKESQMRQFARKPDAHARELDDYTDTAIRTKYNTKDKLKTGLENLNNKLSDLTTKIADIEAKLERATSTKKIASLKRALQSLTNQKLQVENELAVCNSIKFSSLFKTSTWFKNDYSRYIGGNNSGLGAFKNSVGGAITSPGGVTILAASQWDKEYSVPLFGSLTELTKEQAEEYLAQLEKQKTDLENALGEIKKIDTVEKWEQLKSAAAAQNGADKAAEKN